MSSSPAGLVAGTGGPLLTSAVISLVRPASTVVAWSEVIQPAATLPVLLFSLPAGVIGDLAEDHFPSIQTELGDAFAAVRCDVRVESDVEAMVATAVDRFGGLDIAFANAGTGAFGMITDTESAVDLESMISRFAFGNVSSSPVPSPSAPK